MATKFCDMVAKATISPGQIIVVEMVQFVSLFLLRRRACGLLDSRMEGANQMHMRGCAWGRIRREAPKFDQP